jgi:hypothetical protein
VCSKNHRVRAIETKKTQIFLSGSSRTRPASTYKSPHRGNQCEASLVNWQEQKTYQSRTWKRQEQQASPDVQAIDETNALLGEDRSLHDEIENKQLFRASNNEFRLYREDAKSKLIPVAKQWRPNNRADQRTNHARK